MATHLHLELIRCLINQPGVDINTRGLNGKTPLHCAVELDELSLVELLLTQKNINPFVEDNDGRTSLDYATEGKKEEILEALINNKYGSEQDSLLHLAAMMGGINAVSYLIKKGVDVNVRNALQHTPLHLAAGIGHVEIVEVLVQQGNAEIDVFDARNQTPMHYAVNNKKLEVVKLLLKLGGDVNLARKGQGSMELSPLHNAVSSSNYDERDLCLNIVRCLINATDSQVNLQDYENKTPLHYADRLKTIEVLLTREDIDPLVKDDNGKTPFDYAKEGNRPEIIKALISNKYGPKKNSLLHLAACSGDVELVNSIVKEKVGKEEIDIDIFNNKGQSPIYLAAEKGHLNVVKLLLKKGAVCSSVLHLAIKSNNLELLKVLLTNRRLSSLDSDEIPVSVNSPTLDILNRCIEHKNTANKKVKKCDNVICIYFTVNAIAAAIYIGLITTTITSAIIFATITGVLMLVIAIIMSNFARRYIENEFQKKMFMELEGCREIGVCREEYTESRESSSLDDVELEPAIGRGRR